MKPREYTILSECVEEGIKWGWARAHKHFDSPTPGHIQTSIRDAIMLQITEYFSFEEDAPK